MSTAFWLGGLLVALALLLVALLPGPGRGQGRRRSAFLIYPYLDLWDARDVGGRGLYYALMDCPAA